MVLAFAMGAGLAASCQKQDTPQAVDLPTKFDAPDFSRAAGDSPAKEDPEVAAYFKKKGWSLHPDIRIWDGKKLIYLDVEILDKPFERITLSIDDYNMIAKSKTVQVLDLRQVNNTDDGLKTIAGIAQLQGVVVRGEEVTDAGVKELTRCKNLDNIVLVSAEKVTDAGIKELAALPKLQVLYLMVMKLDGSAFEAFAGSKTLESLTLDMVDGFTNNGAKHLAKLPNLKELKVTSLGKPNLTAAGIKAMVDVRLPAKFEFDKALIDDDLLESLVAKGWLYGPTPPGVKEKKPATPEEVKSINLDDSKVTDKGLRVILPCINIKSLFLKRTGVTDETLKKLAGFKKLDYLALGETKVTGAGLTTISGLPIKHLGMEDCTLFEDAFKAFAKMTALEELWLRDAKMKAEWLKHIATLPKLKSLGLMRADFDDGAVKYVTTMPEMHDLTLNNTKLTDTGFQELLKMPKLKSLYVDGTKVSKEVYQKAKKEHPKLTLYFYQYDK
jgi:hypothetical protein